MARVRRDRPRVRVNRLVRVKRRVRRKPNRLRGKRRENRPNGMSTRNRPEIKMTITRASPPLEYKNSRRNFIFHELPQCPTFCTNIKKVQKVNSRQMSASPFFLDEAESGSDTETTIEVPDGLWSTGDVMWVDSQEPAGTLQVATPPANTLSSAGPKKRGM